MNMKALLIVLVAILPAVSFASHRDIQRLANELEQASDHLAHDAKAVGGFSSVSHNARRLSSKAQKLTESIARERSSAYIRTRFTDVSRSYQRVETAFLRTRHGVGNGHISNEFDRVASLYESLKYQFYGDSYYQSFRSGTPAYQSYLYNYDRRPYYSAPRVFINSHSHRQIRSWRPSGDIRINHSRNDRDHRSPVIERKHRRDHDGSGNSGHRGQGRSNGAADGHQGRRNRDHVSSGDGGNKHRRNATESRRSDRVRANRGNYRLAR